MSILKKHLDNLPDTLLELKAKKIMALQESVHVNLYPGNMGVDVWGELDGSEDIVEMPLSDLILNEPAEKMLKPDSKANVRSLVKAIKSGADMDPMLVMQDGDKYRILDGHHRFFAYKLAGKDTAKVFVVPGDEITDVDEEGEPLDWTDELSRNMDEGRPPKKYKGEKQMVLYREIDKIFDGIISGKLLQDLVGVYERTLDQMNIGTMDRDLPAYKFLTSKAFANSIISSYIGQRIINIKPSPFNIPSDNLYNMIRDEVKGHAYKDMMANAISELSSRMQKILPDFEPDEVEEEPEDDGIIREEGQDVDLSALGNIASGIEDELEKIPTNEVVLTTIALVAGIPGILNVIAKAAKTLMQKSGINTSKKQSVLDYIIKVSGEIDGYLDGPFRTMLKPFIQDEAKRKKIAGVLKSLVLIAVGSAGQVDISKVPEIKDVVLGLAPDVGQEILQTKLPNMAEFLKGYLKSL